jgi:predicted transcriptional regulator with HTH domain
MASPDTLFSLSEICRETRLSMNEVIGAIRGIKGQYSPELSLMSLDLVYERKTGPADKRQRKVYGFNKKRNFSPERLDRILRGYRLLGEV